jgi:hypothetical protein
MLQMGPFSEELGIDRMALKIIRSEFFEISEMIKFEDEREDQLVRTVRKRVPPEKKE